MKQIRVYPLADAASPPTMEFLNGSGHDIDTLFPDNFGFFELLAMIVDEEPAEIFGPLERWLMQAIGIEKGTPFNPTTTAKAVLRRGGAAGRGDGAGQHLRVIDTGRLLLSRPQVARRAGGRELHLPAKTVCRRSMPATTSTTWPRATRRR